MDPISNKTALATAGASGEKVYVDDVFSTYLYEGQNTSTNTINNGLDLAGEGGLVWIKRRDGAAINHFLFDTERTNKYLSSNNNSGEFNAPASVYINSYTSTGFVTGDSANIGWQDNFVSWSFRKAPGFFDVVTYTGTGSAQNISHNLGSIPGMIIVKRLDASSPWAVAHRSTSNYSSGTDGLNLNTTDAVYSGTVGSWWNSTGPTSSQFTVGNAGETNVSGGTYVAYLFAHDDQSFGTGGDEAIIQCGTFNGGGVYNSTTIEVNTGFEPQWVLVKRSDSTGNWFLLDTMRGMTDDGSDDAILFPNLSDAESNAVRMWVYQNGFAFDDDLGGTSAEWIYMAIRRPHKPPEAGTDVFDVNYLENGSTNVGFVADAQFAKYPAGTEDWHITARLTGNKVLASNSNAAEDTSTATYWDRTTNTIQFGTYTGYYSNYVFRRAPGFFDVVAYAGDGNNAQTLNHNLAVAPEFYLVKNRDDVRKWAVYHTQLVTDSRVVYLNENSSFSTSWTPDFVNPTATQFTVSQEMGGVSAVNKSGNNHIAYLFATLPGISKVGSYTGTGSNIGVDCGFTAGARFVLIKRTDSTGDWYVWDSTRGIVTGNDPYLLINSTAAEVTNTDYIDPLNAGFTVTSSAPAALNASGGTYIFLAIA